MISRERTTEGSTRYAPVKTAGKTAGAPAAARAAAVRMVVIAAVVVVLMSTLSVTEAAYAAASRATAVRTAGFFRAYGVFVGAGPEDIPKMARYRTVVIDAESFSGADVRRLKMAGHTVYTYLNVGSLESFRSDYEDYRKYCIGAYEGWPDEQWVDVGAGAWQERIRKIAAADVRKGVDGFFVDNCDVYYAMGEQEYGLEDGQEYGRRVTEKRLFSGLCTILRGIRKEYGRPVVINGGDVFVRECMRRNFTLRKYFTAVNQECVYTSVDSKTGAFGRAESEDTVYFVRYLRKVKRRGLKVYVLEYTRSAALARKARKACKANGFTLYIARDLGLGA